jgi:hypothetical protein
MTINIQDQENQEAIANNEGNFPDEVNTPTPVAQPSAQPKIVLTEVLKNPEVKAIIEKVREQEKNKLYKTIESKDAEILRLKGEVDKLQKLVDDKESENLTEAEKMQKQVVLLEKQLSDLSSSIETEREAVQREKKLAQLAAYKERRIREVRDSGADLVLAMVHGDSEEEIETSVEEAINEYAKIVEKANERSKKEKPPVNNTPRVTNPPSAEADTFSADSIKNLSPGEFAKVREKLFKMNRTGQL